MLPRIAERWLAATLAFSAWSAACKGDAKRRHGTETPVDGEYEAKSAFAVSQELAERKRLSCAEMVRIAKRIEGGAWAATERLGVAEELAARADPGCLEPSLAREKPGLALVHSFLELSPSVAQERLTGVESENPSVRAALWQRRGALAFAVGDAKGGRTFLRKSLEGEDDATVRSHLIRLERLAGHVDVAGALCDDIEEDGGIECAATRAAQGAYAEVVRALEDAPLHVRDSWARAALEAAKSPAELLVALESQPEMGRAAEALLLATTKVSGLAADVVLRALRKTPAVAPERAELWMALAEAEEAAGELRKATSAWDRAAERALGAERPILAPIRLLRVLGDPAASERADALARRAESENSSEGLMLASQAYRYAGRAAQAVSFAKKARALDPEHGRIRSELAHRLVEAGQREEAARVLGELLACGSRGVPWHRHEVAQRLRALAGEVTLASITAQAKCAVVAEEDLRAELEAALNSGDAGAIEHHGNSAP